MEEKDNQISIAIEKLNNKDFGLYFFVLDTMGNPTAGIANIYEHVKVLNDLGYNAQILHEKNDYKLRVDPNDGNDNGRMGISEWLGEEYASLPHVSIESQELNITGTDFIIVPEIFANVMEQVKGFPCKKIVLSQSYHYALELLPIGKRWNDYGFNDVITTSDKQANYLKHIFPAIKTYIVPVGIPEFFKSTKKLKTPTIAIISREQSDVLKIVKSFYLQYPTYKWVTFKELRGLPRKTFAEELGDACLAVWIDDVSGFGTFPLEAIESDTPVIGKIPALVPEWMEEPSKGNEITIKDNGIWTNNFINIPELIATYMKVWLEDSIPDELIAAMEKTKGSYSEETQKEKIEEVYTGIISDRLAEFENMATKSQATNTEK